MTLAGSSKQLITVAALWAATDVQGQWEFRIDTAFRTDITRRYVSSIHVTSDDKVVATGQMRFSTDWPATNLRLVRLHSDGSRDEGFYNSGYGGSKVVPWGDRYYVASGIVRRIMADGTLDPSFISMNSSPYFQSLQGGDFHVFPDGRVLMSGTHELLDSIRGFEGFYELIWFSSEGYLDTTRFHRQSDGTIYNFAELPDGRFICSGLGTSYENVPMDRVFRIHADGSPDTSFNTGVWWGEARSYLPLPDGRVYVCGRFQTTQRPGDTLHVARFLADGTLDSSFSPPEFRDSGLNSPHGAYAWSLFALNDAHLIIGGTYITVEGQPRSGICMVDTNGTLMPAFHNQGVGPYDDQGIILTTVQCIRPNADTTALYISGTFNGYNDDLYSDSEQRFISRLLIQETSVGVPPHKLRDESRTAILQIRPNPSNGIVTVDYRVTNDSGKTDLVLFDAQGRTLRKWDAISSSSMAVLELSDVDSGLYLLQLITNEGRSRSERLVIER